MGESKKQLKKKKNNMLILARQMKEKEKSKKSQRQQAKEAISMRRKNAQVLMCSVWGNDRKSEGGFIISTEKPLNKRPQ